MSEIKITDLPLASSVASTDLVLVVANPSGAATTKKTLASTLPVSDATQTALDLKANLAGPTFTSSPASNTGTVDTSSTQIATQAFVIGQAGTATPVVNSGSGAAGSSSRYSRQDHVHPTDSTRAPTASPTFTGIVTTAGQIVFPATANLSSSANTLDDYEEGTFSISWGSGTSVSENFSYKVAQYIKIGKTVFIQVGMPLSSNYNQSGANSGNAVTFTGLPFTPAAVGVGGYGSLSIGYQSGYSTRTASGYISPASTTIYIFDAAGNSITNAMVSATTSYLYFTAFYTTAL